MDILFNVRSWFVLLILVLSVESLSEENMIIENVTDQIFLDPLLASQEAGRKELYHTLKQIQGLAQLLNDYYKSEGSYPNVRQWASYVGRLSNDLKTDADKKFVLDGFGDPFVYMPVSDHEVWFYSLNVYDEISGNEKVSIFKITSGKLQNTEAFEP